MPVANHCLAFRPVRGGTYVFNPNAAAPGTIGFIATSDNNDRWLVSCYHVLCRADFSDFTPGEAIYQPADVLANLVARVTRGERDLDCAAAIVEAGIQTSASILGMATLKPPTEPAAGMRLVKSGMATGITEGVVTSVSPEGLVVIDRPSEYPTEYAASLPGDSGALWVTRDTFRPVALHTGVKPQEHNISCGLAINRVLTMLHLDIVIGS